MKTILLLISLSLLSTAFAETPDFAKIFKEIKAANSASESIAIRGKYLSQMSDLVDFNRLTDLEKLNPGEMHFDHYRKAIGLFTKNNVDQFMLDQGSDEEQDIFAKKIVAKSYDKKTEISLLEKGLFYVDDCEDFKSYLRMSKAPASFSSKHQGEYCQGSSNPGGHGNVFELISNLTLAAGEYKILYLPSTMYITKLYISVEGIRSSAYFDVMVNGDIKGTIYAPGSDPLYIINVADTAGVINLRSMYGDAKITSIKVEYK
jgi:hypothetical protein